LLVFLLRVWGRGGTVKDAGVVGPRAGAVMVVLGARLGSFAGGDRQGS